MSNIEWGDSDSVTCPHCGGKMRDLWDYGWSPADEDLEIECGHCDARLTLHRCQYVDYGVSKRDP